jgi:hypothetical protein
MKALVALMSLPFFMTSCMVVEEWPHGGHGETITETRSLPYFNQVAIAAPVHVKVQSGTRYAAYVTTEEGQQAHLQTDVFMSVLTIDMSVFHSSAAEPTVVVIVPDLKGIIHDDNGLVEIEEDGNFPDLRLELNAGGEIRFFGTASRLRADLNGAGRIYMEGYTDWLQANLRGTGVISGENMLAGDADVVLSGSGSIYLDLDYQSVLNLALTGSGRVEWWGQPAKLNYTLTGTGKVVEHRGIPKRGAGAPAPKKAVPDSSAQPPLNAPKSPQA